MGNPLRRPASALVRLRAQGLDVSAYGNRLHLLSLLADPGSVVRAQVADAQCRRHPVSMEDVFVERVTALEAEDGMNRQRILAVASKEWREIIRDRLFFALAFIVPAFLMLLFGYGLSLDVDHLPLGVVDYDRMRVQSRAYVERFSASHYFPLYGQLTTNARRG